MPAVRAIAREAARNNNRFSSFLLGVVKSTPFQMRRAEDPDSDRDKTDITPTDRADPNRAKTDHRPQTEPRPSGSGPQETKTDVHH